MKATRGRPPENIKLIASDREVLAFFDERIGHYKKLREMYINGELHAYYRGDGGSMTFAKR